MGLLDSLFAQTGLPLVWGGTSGQWPQPPAPKSENEAIWDRIDQETNAQNAAAARRNATIMGLPAAPFIGVPDASAPAVSMALGARPSNDYGTYGAKEFDGWGYGPSEAAKAPAAPASPAAAPAAPPTPPARPPLSLVPKALQNQGDDGDGAKLPAAAAATQGQQPQATSPDFGDRMMAGLKGFISNAHTGPIGAILGGIGGAVSGRAPRNATIEALRSKGVSEADLTAAAGNQEVLKALVNQYYGKDKYTATIIGRDRNGQPVYGSFNTQTGERRPFQAEDAASTGAPDLAGKTGADALAAMDPQTAARVQAIAEGREPYPANSRAPDAARIREAVHAYDPSFDAVNYNSRLATRKDFTSGKSAQNLTAFNTAIGHLGTLYDSIDGLNNSSYPIYNQYVANPIAGQVSPEYQAARKKFEAARTAVADELTRAFRGAGGNVHDIKQWEETINAADSPQALKAAVRQAAELLNSRIQAVGDQYNRGMGTTKDPLELLNPKAAESFRHLLEGSREGGAPRQPAQAGAPQKSAPPSALQPGGSVVINGVTIKRVN